MSGGGGDGGSAGVRTLSEEELTSLRAYRERYEGDAEGARGTGEPADGLSPEELAKIADAEIASLISQEACDLVVYYEVGGRAAYDKRFRRPEWPGAQSGVTIGIGYDIGQSGLEDFTRAWRERLPVDQFDRLARTAGIKGSAAAHLPAELRDIEIPWETAEDVFRSITIARYGRLVLRQLAHARELHPHCFGALFSLVYNRGASFASPGDRYREMRSIRSHMHDRDLVAIPGDLRAMKRLWQGQGLEGLIKRRDAEADLFQRGLAAARPAAAAQGDPQGAAQGAAAGVAARGADRGEEAPLSASAGATDEGRQGRVAVRRRGRPLWVLALLAALAVICAAVLWRR
jgi:GH24 family phage-related lysozyme (muramidase)